MRVSSTQGVAPMAPQADAPTTSSESFHATVHELARVSPPVADTSAARDPWQVIDAVNTLELGGAGNSARHRTMAQSGSTLVEWFAAHAHAAGLDYGPVIAAEAYLASGDAAEVDVGAMDPPKAQTHCIELSQVVSKYIGETEKHLDLVFDRAPRSDAALLFDEADALMGKRSDVKDSHDRYANPQVNDQPQRIVRREGVAMRATDSRQTIDPDLLKRLRAQVQQPAPPGPPRSRD